MAEQFLKCPEKEWNGLAIHFSSGEITAPKALDSRIEALCTYQIVYSLLLLS